MGRKAVVRTPEEEAEQKARWAASRNARRRAAYQADPEYRDKVVQTSRKNYRRTNAVEQVDCRSNISQLGILGEARTVEIAGVAHTLTTFDTAQLAQALGNYHAHGIYRWYTNGQLPRPVVEVVGSMGTKKVFVLDEVLAMIGVLGPHQVTVRYYRQEHTETIDALFAAVETVRRQHGIPSI